MADPSVGQFYCHECSKNFSSSSTEPSCPLCNSEFVELLETQPPEESRTTGVGSSVHTSSTATSTASSFTFPFVQFGSVPTTAPSSTSSSSSSVPQATATSTTTTTSAGASRTTTRNPINITIGAGPLFRGGNDNPFNFFSMFSPRQDSPMETDNGDDPGDELLVPPQTRRRTGSQVRSGQAGSFPNSNVIVLNQQNPRDSLERMIHDQLSSIMQHQVGTESTDQGPPSSQSQQQPQQGTGTPATSQSSTSGNTQQQPRNVQVMHFPPVQIVMGGPRPASGQEASGGPSPLPPMPFPMFFMGGGPGGGGGGGGIHGSPGDYAWGPQGLDNIISRLLANLEDSGPPPTEKAKLDALPSINVTAKDLQECILCSVCKDEFSVGETLVQLPCRHLYHSDCVMPWLKMHDTCPTCRFHLNSEKYDENSSTI